MPKTYHHILIIKPGAIGDLLHLTPVIRALKGTYPGAEVFILVGSEASASLFRNNPGVAGTIVFDRKGAHRSLASRLALWRALRKKDFDLVLNFQRSNPAAWFLASAAFPCRILVYRKSRKRHVHAVANYLETLDPLGIAKPDMTLELHPAAEDMEFAGRLFSSLGVGQSPVVALNAGATRAVNRWSAGRFAALADRISQLGLAKVVIIGGPDDAVLADEIVGKSSSKPPSIAGRTSLLQLAAVLKRCSALVTCDTGPMHVASAVGTKVVALFGASDPERTGPVGTGHIVLQAEGPPCVPCRGRRCSGEVFRACMENIGVDQVAAALLKLLGSKE